VVVELHTDAQERIGLAAFEKNRERQALLARSSALPQYVVINPRTGKVMNKWGWENAEAKRWKQLLTQAAKRWKSVKK
jgi:hypothetical protein